MNEKEYYPLTSRDLIKKLASKIGAEVLIEPEWGVCGRIKWKSGLFSYFKYNSFDLNHAGSVKIAVDKDYTNFFLKQLGFPVVPNSKTFFSDEWSEIIGVYDRKLDNAYKYAESIGFPVIVKPNSGSQGKGVFFVSNKDEFYKAGEEIFQYDRIILVQSVVSGVDCRIVVLDDKVISAYTREPFSVIGDGVFDIESLVKNKKEFFKKQGKGNIIDLNDIRISNKLNRLGLKMSDVLRSGEKVFLLDNANLSTGGESVDVTREINQDFKDIAINITKGMGLRICGVDIMVNGDITEKPNEYYVLEINSSPGLDHYAKSGEEQKKIVEDLYLELLKKMER